MKVLIIGNGAREHALAWKFSQSKRICGLFCLPGNAGTAALGQNLDISIDDNQAIVNAAAQHQIDLVFIGPEAPLANGLADDLRAAGVPTVGPAKLAAQLESSKAFTKAFLTKHKIPTASSESFTKAADLRKYLKDLTGPWVVKKSGLAAGKGVLESDNMDELIAFGEHAIQDDCVVVEEYLKGFEVSIFTVSDGQSWQILPPTADYKKASEGNIGPNTGGMGAICPVPWLDKAMQSRIVQEIVTPVMQALQKDGLLYPGILYYGLMITKEGPKVIEFNVRFGDPEAQVLIPLIENDFCNLWEAVANGRLSQETLQVSANAALGIVVAAPGYPGDYPTGMEASINFTNHEQQRIIFHASTKLDGSILRTGGGRCFTAVGLGAELMEARAKAYTLLPEINFDGAWCRNDIGANIYAQKY